MLHRQRGAYNLAVVGILTMVLAGAAMVALMSARYERNYFAEGAARLRTLVGDSPAVAQAAESARGALAQNEGKNDGKMRRCVIDGKTVISNVDCSDKNPTSKVIKIQETKGFEAPKKPAEPAPEAGAPTATDKMIEKQLR